MKRKIVTIDEETCNGCGLCIPNCPEGAMQVIDGKARLISDLLCDGLGACLGHCPVGAITIEERESEPYDERKVMANVVRQGPGVIRAHLEHLRDHGEDGYLREAVGYLNENGIGNPLEEKMNQKQTAHAGHAGCPGSRSMSLAEPATAATGDEAGQRPSRLTHWPVQLHLMSPTAPAYRGKDVLLAADCVAYAVADFHRDWLNGKSLAIACPKLDVEQEVYLDKVTALIDQAKINTLTVMTMEVPCCGGLLRLAQTAASRATRKVPLKHVVVGLRGDILHEAWI